MIQQSSYGFALAFRAHDLRPEIYVNRLGTTTKIFIAMDYLILRSEKYLHFRKRQKYVARNFFAHPVEVTLVIFSEFCLSQRYKQKLEINLNTVFTRVSARGAHLILGSFNLSL